MMTDYQQLEIDWSAESNKRRRERLRWLIRNAKLPKPNLSVSILTIRKVLDKLDSMIGSKDGFRVYVATIAADLFMSISAVRRAIAYLKSLGIILINRTGRSSLYSICAEALERWASPQKNTSQPVEPEKPPTAKQKQASTSKDSSATKLNSWTEVAEKLRQIVLDATGEQYSLCWKAINIAKANGASCADVLALATYWSEHRPRWDVGALHQRICNCGPNDRVEDNWMRGREPPKPKKRIVDFERWRAHVAKQFKQQGKAIPDDDALKKRFEEVVA